MQPDLPRPFQRKGKTSLQGYSFQNLYKQHLNLSDIFFSKNPNIMLGPLPKTIRLISYPYYGFDPS